MKLISLEVDPLSKRIEQNTTCLDKLSTSLKDLPTQISTLLTQQTSACQSSLKVLHDQLSSKSSALTAMPTSLSDSSKDTSADSSTHHYSRMSKPKLLHRPSNINCFGVPETRPLSELQSIVDDLSSFLAGRSITVNDAFHLGRRDGKQSTEECPRLLLIKLSSVWDKRLILFSVYKLPQYKTPRFRDKKTSLLKHISQGRHAINPVMSANLPLNNTTPSTTDVPAPTTILNRPRSCSYSTVSSRDGSGSDSN